MKLHFRNFLAQWWLNTREVNSRSRSKLLDNVFSAFENKVPAVSVHFDLKKAFDTIDHNLLLKKLEFYGLNDLSINLMRSYLSNRSQIVKIDTESGPIFSESRTIKLGVPQGSILGPLLFIIFVNDLPEFLDAPTYLFADDTSTVVWGDEAINHLKRVYQRANSWFLANGLSLNESKTQLVSYTPSVRVKAPNGLCPGEAVQVDDKIQLNFQEDIGFLGVRIDYCLTWKFHIEKLVGNLQRSKWAVRNLVKIASLESALMFYHANIMSHIRYGIILWGGSNNAKLVSREHLKILRLLFNKPYGSECKELLVYHKLFSVTSLYIFECLKYSIENCYIEPRDLLPSHSYNIRHLSISNPITCYKISESNVKFTSIKMFNSLPPNVKAPFKDSNFTLFFASLKKFLLDNPFNDLNEFFPSF